MGKNNPNANPIWGETYANECCEGYLWNQGISRTQGSNFRLQNLLTTEPLAGNIASVFILGTTATGEVFKLIWQTEPTVEEQAIMDAEALAFAEAKAIEDAEEAERRRIDREMAMAATEDAPGFWVIEQERLAAQAIIDAQNELIRLKKLKTDTQ